MLDVVDTGALAVHLGCTPAYVRLFVHEQILTPIGRWRRLSHGRPTMWFDLNIVEKELEAAKNAGKVTLDNGRWRVRR